VITPGGIREKAGNQYRAYLRQLIAQLTDTVPEGSAPFFPLVIRCNTGSASDNITERAAELEPLYENSKNRTGSGYTLRLEKRNTRTNAEQTVISSVYFESEKDFLSFTEKMSETTRLRDAIALILKENHSLAGDNLRLWAEKHIPDLTAVHERGFWHNIVCCVRWFRANPQSGLYIREIPLPVHTKFIENSKELIHSMLSDKIGTSFEAAHGLKDKPLQIRFRMLAPDTPLLPGNFAVSELTLPLSDFEKLPETPLLSAVRRIILVENEMVYLTFPPLSGTLCIWGHGYTVTKLASCGWLHDYVLYYSGDIDEHGFDILSSFRSYFPEAGSFCMDSETLAAFDEYRVKGVILAGNAIPQHLTEKEQAVFMQLRSSPERNRLEQERIPVEYIRKQNLYLHKF
jgi:hypothetical protein